MVSGQEQSKLQTFSFQHKMRVLQNKDNVFGITVPSELGKKFLGTYFRITYEGHGIIVMESGAKARIG